MKYPESESSVLEFKEAIPENGQIAKTAVAFCNLHGGRLIIGIKDDKTVVGVTEDAVEELLEHIHKMIYESCTPPIMPEVFTQRIDDKIVVVIRISPGINKPYYIRSIGIEKGTFVRLGRCTLRADPTLIEELKRQARGISFDATPVYHCLTSEIDVGRFRAFLEARPRGFSGQVDSALLQAYHLVHEEQTQLFPTVGGLLLFGKKPPEHLSEAFIICSVIKGDAGRQVTATVDCTGSLFDQVDHAYDFIVSHLEHSFTIAQKKRVDQYEIPLAALREALLNAVVHRNYAVAGPVKISMFDNRIELFSPGTFPGPLLTSNLTAGITYIRNSVISKIFREAGYIEKMGTGFITIFSSYQKAGLPTPEVIEGENYIKCILPRKKIAILEVADGDALLQLFFRKPELSIADVIEELGVSRATAGRRLSELERHGTLKRIGNGRTTRYLLSGEKTLLDEKRTN